MKEKELIEMLRGGDRRSIAGADRVAALLDKAPGLFGALVRGMCNEDPLVKMRAADAAEKVTRKRPELLRGYKKELLGLLREAGEQELRWHLAAMVPRLGLSAKERKAAMETLGGYLEDRSSIVRTFALQGLVELAGEDETLRAGVEEILGWAVKEGTAAMKARARKLLKKLHKREHKNKAYPSERSGPAG